MFDVLVYLYENYWRPEACPEPDQLRRKLSAVGFESDEIRDALQWLDGLDSAQAILLAPPAQISQRVYLPREEAQLGPQGLGFLRFLESTGTLTPALREQAIDRAMAAGDGPLPLDDLKVILLMLFWSRGEEPDALVFDELFDVPEDRVIH
jgi:Smg protein